MNRVRRKLLKMKAMNHVQPQEITPEEFFRSLPESEQRRLREFFGYVFTEQCKSELSVIHLGTVQVEAA